jgi:hypothetical protein
LEDVGAGAIAHRRLKEALSFAVGRGAYGLVRRCPTARACTGVAEIVAAIGIAIFGQDALDGDAVAREPVKGPLTESDGAGLAVVGRISV